ncbi:MAG: UDP-N-acetylglucosamine pyrophosphorylase [Firmicutes bacterium]|nr:UDP-N-acetylglucosamine pyrophosphorylase [Bacillota bacterium]
MECEYLFVNSILDLTKTDFADLFDGIRYPWEALDKISDYIREAGELLPKDEFYSPSPDVWISKSAKVAPTAYIAGPTIISADTEVRHCAFIRGSALVGKGCVVGNSTELKNVVLFDGVQVPHYNYVGDSILGYKAHMGAASLTSNVKGDKHSVAVHTPDGDIFTGRRKFGAILGDFAEIGCGAVLNPGVIIGKGSRVYPLVSVRGVVPANSICKGGKESVPIIPDSGVTGGGQ